MKTILNKIREFPFVFGFLTLLYALLFHTVFMFSTSVQVVAKTPTEIYLKVEK